MPRRASYCEDDAAGAGEPEAAEPLTDRRGVSSEPRAGDAMMKTLLRGVRFVLSEPAHSTQTAQKSMREKWSERRCQRMPMQVCNITPSLRTAAARS
jgi:hypothetical protein